jgi:hypothetical protein
MSDALTPSTVGSDEGLIATIAYALRHQGRKVTHDADRLIALAAAEQPPKDGARSVRAAVVQTFMDAADDLLAAQQRHMPHPLSDELRALTDAYIAARSAAMDASFGVAASRPKASK